MTLYYGASREEAMSEEGAETLDTFALARHNGTFTAPVARAMRYELALEAGKTAVVERR